ncbi:type 1 glutamine amidotransferase family protein [Geomesophilobacter sediminis]|uniref:Uncharacterized protein n=1 Tax=Geomesophilobacter sediminis TaxID=2798584 RepID=A0A8J7M1U1_9BACT|nr:hypothetical protein [Geomesophilobacter sediminis]MBJ6727092.1 hypothetical protein [Geomesophilobacter sediminis]
MEILKAEGLNEFSTCDVLSLTADRLVGVDFVILPEIHLAPPQLTLLKEWVQSGGNLIAMRPQRKLASWFGLSDLSYTISNGYIQINTDLPPGQGLVTESIQFHGAADLYNLREGSQIATLQSSSYKPGFYPAATVRSAGTNGGHVAAFAFDLAKSVVLTRQGNPEWSGQPRDGRRPIRSNDLFFGASRSDPQPDWINQEKISIPQADEQQRLLTNLITLLSLAKTPLPHFWYLPRGVPAAIVMTGDDHGHGGTVGRFDTFLANSPFGCSVEKWECIRGTSYTYTDTPLTEAEAMNFENAGFEIALHVNTGCVDWTPTSLTAFFDDQLTLWRKQFQRIGSPSTMRIHCIAWSDYATLPLVEQEHGIHLDTSYYYWPAPWVRNRAGFFTGSGIPMRFADNSGRTIDVFQVPTQMTDESGQTYPYTVDRLLDAATGKDGFYGVFAVNAHTDREHSDVANAVIKSAQAHNVPVVSARQMLRWLQGKDGSTIHLTRKGANGLGVKIYAAPGSEGLTVMVPVDKAWADVQISRQSHPVDFTMVVSKGIRYARFLASSGEYTVNFRGHGDQRSDTR